MKAQVKVCLLKKLFVVAALLIALLAISCMWTSENVYAAGNTPGSAETISLGQNVTGIFPAGTKGEVYHYYKFKTKNLKDVEYVLRVSNDYVEDDTVLRHIEYSIIDSDYLDSPDVDINASEFSPSYYSNGGFIMSLHDSGSSGTMRYPSLKKNSWHYVKIKLDQPSFDTLTKENQYSFQVVPKKVANPLNVKAKTGTVKYSKSKARTLPVSKVITFKNKGKGKLTYTKSSGNKKIIINKKTGKVTVKKGLKKGTYKVKVKVKAAGNADYAAGSKTVTIKIKVK